MKTILYPNERDPIVRIRNVMDISWLARLQEWIGPRLWLITGLNALRDQSLPKEDSVGPMLRIFNLASEMEPCCWHTTEYPTKAERSRGIPHTQYSRYYVNGEQMSARVFVAEGFFNISDEDIPALEFTEEVKLQSVIDASLAVYFGYNGTPAISDFLKSLELECAGPGPINFDGRWLSGLLRGFEGCLVTGHDGEDAYLAAKPESLEHILDKILPAAVQAITDSSWYQANRSSLVWDDELGQLSLRG